MYDYTFSSLLTKTWKAIIFWNSTHHHTRIPEIGQGVSSLLCVAQIGWYSRRRTSRSFLFWPFLLYLPARNLLLLCEQIQPFSRLQSANWVRQQWIVTFGHSTCRVGPYALAHKKGLVIQMRSVQWISRCSEHLALVHVRSRAIYCHLPAFKRLCGFYATTPTGIVLWQVWKYLAASHNFAAFTPLSWYGIIAEGLSLKCEAWGNSDSWHVYSMWGIGYEQRFITYKQLAT